MEKIEYRVRPVVRFVVTRYEQSGDGSASVDTRGEYDNVEMAYEVGYALCKADHDLLGWPPGDERIQYPEPAMLCRKSKEPSTDDPIADSLEDKAHLYSKMADDLRAQAGRRRFDNKIL